MKVTIDYEKEEYVELIGMVNKLTQVFETFVNNQHKEKMARIQTERLRTVGSMFDSMSDEFDDEEDSETIQFGVVPGGKQTPADLGPFASKGEKLEKALEMSSYAQKGQTYFNDLVELWLIGFNIEGAEQPPRAERCFELTQNYEGRAIIHYLEYLKSKYPNGGLTYAIRDSGLVSPEQTRLMAENMTAVSSACRYTQFASYLEHPDPSKMEDFFNV